MLQAAQAQTEIDIEIPWWVGEILPDPTPMRETYITKGLGAGGTYGAACWHYLRCLDNPKSRFSWHVAPTHSEIDLTSMPIFWEVLSQRFGLKEGKHFEIIRSSPQKIKFRWGQEIVFMSAYREERLVGASISHASGTECQKFSEETYQQIAKRCRCPKAKIIQRLYEGVPERDDDAYAARANFEEGLDEAKNRRRINVWTTDNTALPPEYYPTLLEQFNHDPARCEMYTKGVFRTITKGSAYWEFYQSDVVTLDVRADPRTPIAISWDFQKAPLSWVACQTQNHFVGHAMEQEQLKVFLGESTGEARGIMDACIEFMVQFPPDKFKHTRIEIDGGADGFSGSFHSDQCAFDQIREQLKAKYQNVSIVADKKAPKIRDRLERTNDLFAYKKVRIAAWMKNLIHAYSNTGLKPGEWSLQKNKDATKDTTHYSDAADYHLWRSCRDWKLRAAKGKRVRGISR